MNTSPSIHGYASLRVEYTLDVSHDRFTRGLEALLGRMDLDTLRDAATRSPEDAKERLAAYVGPSDFTLFQKLDHGALLTTFTGRRTRATTYVFGNALIAIELTRQTSRVGLYVPLRLFVQEISSARVIVTYDLPSATLAHFQSREVDAVARTLDAKVERLVANAAKQLERVRAEQEPS